MDIKSRVKKSLVLVVVVIFVNIGLAIAKMFIGLSTNSLTIMLDATNSILDVLTSVITAAAFCTLFIKRSEKAPYGYGRAEYLAGFVVAAVTVVTGGLFLMRSLNRLAMPEPVYFGFESCMIIAACVPVKIVIGVVYLQFNKKFKSKALYAIMLDSFLDAGITTTSLVCFAVTAKVDYAADAFFGIALSIIIIAFGIKAVTDSARSATLGAGTSEEEEKIRELATSRNLEVLSMRLHDYGYAMKVGDVQIAGGEEDAKALEEEIKQALAGEIKVYPAPSEKGTLSGASAQEEIREESDTVRFEGEDGDEKESVNARCEGARAIANAEENASRKDGENEELSAKVDDECTKTRV